MDALNTRATNDVQFPVTVRALREEFVLRMIAVDIVSRRTDAFPPRGAGSVKRLESWDALANLVMPERSEPEGSNLAAAASPDWLRRHGRPCRAERYGCATVWERARRESKLTPVTYQRRSTTVPSQRAVDAVACSLRPRDEGAHR